MFSARFADTASKIYLLVRVEFIADGHRRRVASEGVYVGPAMRANDPQVWKVSRGSLNFVLGNDIALGFGQLATA